MMNADTDQPEEESEWMCCWLGKHTKIRIVCTGPRPDAKTIRRLIERLAIQRDELIEDEDAEPSDRAIDIIDETEPEDPSESELARLESEAILDKDDAGLDPATQDESER